MRTHVAQRLQSISREGHIHQGASPGDGALGKGSLIGFERTREWGMDGVVVKADAEGARQDPFATTHWSVVLEAAGSASPEARAALGALYQAYSRPLYLYVLRRGYGEHDAQDLLHDFFHALIGKNYLKNVRPERGRFRAFLLGALKHFLAKDWNHAHRQKRGGQCEFVTLDSTLGDTERPSPIDAEAEVPGEVLFDLEWARTLLGRAMGALRQEYEASGRKKQFHVLKEFLASPGDASAYGKAGAELGLSDRAVKVAVHRIRHRFQQTLRREIGSTVGVAGEIEGELRHLAAVLRESTRAGLMAGDGI